MLNSKTLAKVMLTFSVAGAVVTGGLLVPPPATPVAPSVALPFATIELPDDEQGKEEASAVDTPPVNDEPAKPEPEEKNAPSDSVVAVPAVGFSAPASETRTVDGVVTPPDFEHIFRITDVNAEVYVTHSCRYEACLGNTLFDLPSGEVFVKEGQDLWVKGERHVVTEIRKVKKEELPFDAVWRTDGVAVITCFQNKDYTQSTHNLVVIAQPVSVESADTNG